MSKATQTYSVRVSDHLNPDGHLIDNYARDTHAESIYTVEATSADMAVDTAERITGRMAFGVSITPT